MATTSYPGRVIIDHRPKTGGQAVTGWLAHNLGSGCVSTNLFGAHSELIKIYGGVHSIISGHVDFPNRTTMDPRYQYVTCLRNPVDRAISWLFYVLNDARIDQKSKHVGEAAAIFLESDGKECPEDLISDYSNHYITHFAKVAHRDDAPRDVAITDADKFEAALVAIRHYDVVGIYEDFPGYLKDIANLVGIDAPAEIPKVNVSTRHREAHTVSAELRERLIQLNQDDIRFYDQIIAWKRDKLIPAAAKRDLGWIKYNFREPPAANEVPGSAVIEGAVPDLTINETVSLPVKITNRSRQNWGDDPNFPIQVSYHWLRSSGEVLLYDGERTPLPDGGVVANGTRTVEITVKAPSEAGSYTLVISLIQIRFCWFERKGFDPGIVQVVVKDPPPAIEAPRRSKGYTGLVRRMKSIYRAAATPPAG